MDPGTGLTILGSAVGGAKLVEKILGPTAEYLGNGIRTWTENRVKNVARVFQKAQVKLGDRIQADGAVPPRVLKEVLDNGSFCDDELTAEYFGGVLASSRTPNGRDDRGATYLRLTSDLSSYQIRFHYVCYFWFREHFVGSGLRTTFTDDLEKMRLFLPSSFVRLAMDFSSMEPVAEILLHCTSGLDRQDLLETDAWGEAKHLNELGKKMGWRTVTQQGFVVWLTQFGLDYFLWAIGAGQFHRGRFLDVELSLPKLPEIAFQGQPTKLIDAPRA
jgi:hypothetical protein